MPFLCANPPHKSLPKKEKSESLSADARPFLGARDPHQGTACLPFGDGGGSTNPAVCPSAPAPGSFRVLWFSVFRAITCPPFSAHVTLRLSLSQRV